MEPARRIELRLHPYQGRVLPLSLGRHGWPGWTRTSVVTWFKAMAPLPTEQPAIRAATGCHPRLAVLTGDARSLDPAAWCARGDSNPEHLASRASLSAKLEYEHTEPSARLERAASSLRGKRSGLVSYEGVAAGQGLEPRFRGPEPRVLPLDDPALVRAAGFGPAPVRLLRTPPLPLGYARVRRQSLELRIPRVRAGCCTCIARGAQSRTGESNPDGQLGRLAS